MGKRVICLFLSMLLIITASLAMAGGAPYANGRCAPRGGNPCAYWGDAPFPGLCGGVVALPSFRNVMRVRLDALELFLLFSARGSSSGSTSHVPMTVFQSMEC